MGPTKVPDEERLLGIGCPLPICDLSVGCDIEPIAQEALGEGIKTSLSLLDGRLPLLKLSLSCDDCGKKGLEIWIEGQNSRGV